MSVTQDILEVVREHRPVQAELADHWPIAQRQAVLERILASEPKAVWADSRASLSPRRRRHRTIKLISVGVSLAAVIVSVLSIVRAPQHPNSPSGKAPAGTSATPKGSDPVVTAPISFAAKTLPELAHIAASRMVDTVQPGKYLQRIVKAHQDAIHEPGIDQPAMDEERRSWMSYDGYTWRVDVSATKSLYMAYKVSGGLADPAPVDVGRLPTDPAALAQAIRNYEGPPRGPKPGGRPSYTSYLVKDLGGLFLTGVLPPVVRSTAIAVLASLPGVTVQSGAADSLGRPALAVRYVDGTQDAMRSQSLLFDPTTSLLLEWRMGGGIPNKDDYVETVLSASAVDTVPKDIADGVAKWMDGPHSMTPDEKARFPKPKVG